MNGFQDQIEAKFRFPNEIRDLLSLIAQEGLIQSYGHTGNPSHVFLERIEEAISQGTNYKSSEVFKNNQPNVSLSCLWLTIWTLLLSILKQETQDPAILQQRGQFKTPASRHDILEHFSNLFRQIEKLPAK